MDGKRTCARTLLALLSPLVEKTLRDDDSPDESARKWLMMPFSLVATLSVSLVILYNLIYWEPSLLIVDVIISVPPLGIMVFGILTKSMPLWVCEVGLASIGLTICLMIDFLQFGTNDLWSGMVVIADTMLLVGCRMGVMVSLRNFTVAYIILLTSEETFRYGVFDALPNVYESDAPEAAGFRNGLIRLIVRVAVFLLDFALTYRFASGMKQEQLRMERSVQLAQDLAEAFVAFDLPQAEGLLQLSQEQGELVRAFEKLLDNLKQYRPYLPDALFTSSETGGVITLNTPPSGDDVTIVFTDIQGSTALWESCSTAMRRALDTYNNVIRKGIAQCGGYEVKTVGDSFMICFPAPIAACRFALRTQVLLRDSNWPSELHPERDSRSEGTATDGGRLWHGLRVRTGIHRGSAVVRTNPITGRADYFGAAVNLTARIEGLCGGGVICATGEVLRSLSAEDLDDLGSPHVVKVSDVTLKGGAVHTVSAMVPSELRERLAGLQIGTVRDESHKDSRSRSSSDFRIVPLVGRNCIWASGARSSIKRRREAPPNISTLTEKVATVVHVRMEYHNFPVSTTVECSVQVNSILSLVLDTADRCEGVLLSLCGNTVVLCWNTARPCASHPTQAVHYAQSLRSSLGDRGENICVAITTGPVLHGHVGTTSQRFVMGMGSCINMATHLALAALETYRTFAVLSHIPGYPSAAEDPGVASFLRPIDWLRVLCKDREDRSVVYEVNCTTPIASSKWWLGDQAQQITDAGWQSPYRMAFEHLLEHAVKELSSPRVVESSGVRDAKNLVEEIALSDGMVAAVADRFRKGVVTTLTCKDPVFSKRGVRAVSYVTPPDNLSTTHISSAHVSPTNTAEVSVSEAA